MFGTDIRAVVPQIALSAGTMVALSCRAIVMGHHSSLGPIDSQTAGLPAHAIIEEFGRARRDIAENPLHAAVWQPIIAKYSPTVIGEAEKAIEWANEIVGEWFATGMFDGDPAAATKVERVLRELGDALTKSHDRHISIGRARDIGLSRTPLEEDPSLQDAVLSVHHATMQTLAAGRAVKIVENQLGGRKYGRPRLRALHVAAPGAISASPRKDARRSRAVGRLPRGSFVPRPRSDREKCLLSVVVCP